MHILVLSIFDTFLHYSGSNNTSGTWYGFWSGFGSDLTEFIAFGTIGTIIYKKLNCHEDSCRRIGMHHVDGTPYWTCREHHPNIDHTKPITASVIAEASHRFRHPHTHSIPHKTDL